MTHGRAIIMNRKQAQEVESRPYTAVISIYTPGDKPPNLGPFWPMLLTLPFYDRIPEKGEPYKEGDFSMAQAIDIVKFIDAYSTYDFLVHCDAGISRSMAVGEYIHRTYGHKLDVKTMASRQSMNTHISRLLERAREATFASTD